MKQVCPLCNRQSHTYLKSKDFNRRLSSQVFDYHRCPFCNLVFLSTIPRDLSAFYPSTYYSVPMSYKDLETAAQQDRCKMKTIQQFITKGRLLEIGSSYGKFAFLAKEAGFDVEVLERDYDCCKFLQETIGIKAINSDNPSEGLRAAEKYNVIALWHVIEHLHNPWNTLEIISNKLSADGILVIATPNPDAFQFQVLGRYWTHLDAPRHLFLIPLSLLKKQAYQLGLSLIWSTTRGEDILKCNISGWIDSLANCANHRFLKRRLRSLGRGISLITRPIEYVSGLGSTYTAVFRKISGS